MPIPILAEGIATAVAAIVVTGVEITAVEVTAVEVTAVVVESGAISIESTIGVELEAPGSAIPKNLRLEFTKKNIVLS